MRGSPYSVIDQGDHAGMRWSEVVFYAWVPSRVCRRRYFGCAPSRAPLWLKVIFVDVHNPSTFVSMLWLRSSADCTLQDRMREWWRYLLHPWKLVGVCIKHMENQRNLHISGSGIRCFWSERQIIFTGKIGSCATFVWKHDGHSRFWDWKYWSMCSSQKICPD